MSPLHSHIVVLLPLAAATFMIACSSQNPSDRTFGQEASESSPTTPNDESPPKAANPARWVATLDHGDKPGNGYELIVHDRTITDGKFYLLDPSKPHDLNSAGQSVAFENINHTDKELTFSITLATGDGKYHDTLTITLLDNLVGKVGRKAPAKVQFNQPKTASQELLFVRRE